jgi:hypothetical protein
VKKLKEVIENKGDRELIKKAFGKIKCSGEATKILEAAKSLWASQQNQNSSSSSSSNK